MHTTIQNILGEPEAVIGVVSSALLGHWSCLHLLIITFAATWIGALVIGYLYTMHPEIQVRLQIHKLASGTPTIRASVCWLLDWLTILKLAAKLTILNLKTRYLRRKCRILLCVQRQLLLHQVNHVFGQTSGAADANNLFGGVNGAHNRCDVKWPHM
jgi:hypothetical protein